MTSFPGFSLLTRFGRFLWSLIYQNGSDAQETNDGGEDTNKNQEKEAKNSEDDKEKKKNKNEIGSQSSHFIENLLKSDSKEFLPQETFKIDFNIHPTFIQRFGTKSAKKKLTPIFGLTVLRKELFIISEHSQEIEVYESNTLKFKRQLVIKDLFDPIDIKSCHKNNYLFIFDWKTSNGEIIKLNSDGDLLTKWSTGEAGGFISVTREGNVLLSVWEHKKLQEYTPDGKIQRTIKLEHINELKLGLKLNETQFIVSHGEDDEKDHRVCIVNEKGLVTRHIGDKPGVTDGQFNQPNYLAVDGTGHVLVADQNNKRVVLLSPELGFKQTVIQEKDGLRYPVRLELDERNGRLFIADNNYLENDNKWTDGRVVVFEFKNSQLT